MKTLTFDDSLISMVTDIALSTLYYWSLTDKDLYETFGCHSDTCSLELISTFLDSSVSFRRRDRHDDPPSVLFSDFCNHTTLTCKHATNITNNE